MFPIVARFLGATAASRLVNPAPTPVWQETMDTTLGLNVPGWANYTMRTALDRFLLPASASKFRARWATVSPNQLQITKAYIGVGTGTVYSATPTQIFFGGNPGVTITSSGVECDDVDFAYDGTQNLILSYYCPTGASAQDTSYSNQLFGARRSFNLNDLTTQVGGTWSDTRDQTIGLVEMDSYADFVWTETFKAGTALQIGSSGWNGFTLRTRFEAGVFPASGYSDFRLAIGNQVSDIFIGNAVDVAGSFEFAATPTRLTFGAANASPANFNSIHVTDVAALSVIDRTKPVLVSFHNTNNQTCFIPVGSNATGARSKVKSGNDASTISESGFAQVNGGVGDYFGPVAIDVQ
jgi:hypothetical protein